LHFLKKVRTYLEYFYRFFVHALGPDEFWSLVWLPRSQKNFQSFLHVVHEVLSGIRIVQKVLAYDKLEWLSERHRRLGSEGMPGDAICG
jgi:hypothetical protein